jgi:hypothetical protein
MARPAEAGLITTFDDLVGWQRVRQVSGALAQSTATVHGNAPYSAELSYRFAPGSDFLVLEKSYPLGGHPAQISAWVYGDGSGIFLNCWISDVDQEVWQFSFGQIKHTGWRKMTAVLNPNALSGANRQVSGAITATMDYPLDFQALVLDHAPNSSNGTGKVYISELTASEVVGLVPPTGTERATPAAGPVRPTIKRSEERRVGKECDVMCRSRWSPYH